MNIFVFEESATQAKLVLQRGFAVIKIPKTLPYAQRKDIREKFLHLIEIHKIETGGIGNDSLKAYYKIGTPFVFLNRRVNSRKRETVATYSFNDL
jgi:hypothetical protein